MKAKITLASIIVFTLGFCIGAMYLRFQEYARSAPIGMQGKDILKEIREFKTKNGEYPDQKWFSNLGDKLITSEKRIWVYHTPPIKSSDDNYILISVPVDRGNSYLFGYSKGYVSSGSCHNLKFSEQDGAPNPNPR